MKQRTKVSAKVHRLANFCSIGLKLQEWRGRVGPIMTRHAPLASEPPVTEHGGEERDRNLEATIRQRSQANAVRVSAVNDCGV